MVVSIYVRASSGSGRIDLAATVSKLLSDIAKSTATSGKPMVTTLFGNPYVAMFLTDVPSILVTYDLYDAAEAAAVRALVGEAPITGKLPISMPGAFTVGTGIVR